MSRSPLDYLRHMLDEAIYLEREAGVLDKESLLSNGYDVHRLHYILPHSADAQGISKSSQTDSEFIAASVDPTGCLLDHDKVQG